MFPFSTTGRRLNYCLEPFKVFVHHSVSLLLSCRHLPTFLQITPKLFHYEGQHGLQVQTHLVQSDSVKRQDRVHSCGSRLLSLFLEPVLSSGGQCSVIVGLELGQNKLRVSRNTGLLFKKQHLTKTVLLFGY